MVKLPAYFSRVFSSLSANYIGAYSVHTLLLVERTITPFYCLNKYSLAKKKHVVKDKKGGFVLKYNTNKGGNSISSL